MGKDSELSADLRDELSKHRGRSGQQSGALVLSDQEGYVGDTITLKGRNLQAGEEYEIVWNSVDGEWGVLEANEIVGPQYRPRQEIIDSVRADDSGSFDLEWTVFEDYGGGHKLELRHGQETVAEATFDINPWFELERSTVPLGDVFLVRGYGLGPSVSTNNYQIAWNNSYVGYMTGVKNRGTASAGIRAVGPPGEHVIQVWRNYQGIPYITNNTQSPLGPVGGERDSLWTVEVTEPETPPDTAWVESMPEERPIELHYPDLDQDTDAQLEISPQCGQVGTTAILTGSGFPAHTEVDLRWYQHVGEGIRGTDPDLLVREGVLPTVTTDSDGGFQYEFEIPQAEGSSRPITAAVDGREVAVTGFMMQPSIVTFEPTSGPVGTMIEVEVSGIGWTTYEKAPIFVYDNHILGYGCGMSGENRITSVRTILPAGGQPGWHFLDLYPAISDMHEDEPYFEHFPHLSYLDNHPVRPLPVCRMAFEIEE